MFDFLLYWLYSKEHGINAPGSQDISSLKLSDYTIDAFNQAGIRTVGDAVWCKIRDEKIEGVGKKSWKDFLEAIKK